MYVFVFVYRINSSIKQRALQRHGMNAKRKQQHLFFFRSYAKLQYTHTYIHTYICMYVCSYVCKHVGVSLLLHLLQNKQKKRARTNIKTIQVQYLIAVCVQTDELSHKCTYKCVMYLFTHFTECTQYQHNLRSQVHFKWYKLKCTNYMLIIKTTKKRLNLANTYINRKIDANHVTFYKVYPLLNCSTRRLYTILVCICNTMTNARQYCEI